MTAAPCSFPHRPSDVARAWPRALTMSTSQHLQTYLDGLVAHFERAAFIADDPIAIPHAFDDPRDQEVIGLYAALLAWGRRETVLMKLADLCERMEYRPYEYVLGFCESRDAPSLDSFKHRTFQPEDALWFTKSLSLLLRRHDTVEAIFSSHLDEDAEDIGDAIEGFSRSIAEAIAETPDRLRKHLARPRSGSACKRLCMYLRWMVRPGPVDLGIWRSMHPRQLVLPLDVHSGRQARILGLLQRKANDWRSALELTRQCRQFSPEDPARFDYALFGLGVYGDPLTEQNDVLALRAAIDKEVS